jgi:hypothetical protein
LKNDLDQTEIKVPYYELPEGWENKCDFSFEELSSLVIHIHESSYNSAVRAVNRMATIRNYIIGFYIVEYEQNGKDRSVYGSRLISKLAEKINKKGINETLLKVSRSFYLTYPQVKNYLVGKSATVSHQFETSPELLLSRLSFSHIREILTVDDKLARFFYETECIKCCWSVKELRRQISTNLFFRAGLSKNPEKMLIETKDSSFIFFFGSF